MKDLSFKAMTEFASKVKHSGLTQREKDILLMRVGYNQDKPMSLQQIANAISDYKQENKHNNYTDTRQERFVENMMLMLRDTWNRFHL